MQRGTRASGFLVGAWLHRSSSRLKNFKVGPIGQFQALNEFGTGLVEI
jgi:hypothetical protein